MSKRWSDEDEQVIRAMYRAGATDSETAARLGRTRLAVLKHRQLLGIKRSTPGVSWTFPEVAILRNLRRKGYLPLQIARELGRSESSVIAAMHRFRVVVRTRKEWSGIETQSLLAMAQKKLSFDKIGWKLDRTRGSIEQKLRRLRRLRRLKKRNETEKHIHLTEIHHDTQI